MARFSPVIVDHFTQPRNSREVPDADVRAFVGNPVCGDQILLAAKIESGVVTDIGFQAFGCSASLAVASLLTTTLMGMTIDEVAAVDAAKVHDLTGSLAPDQRHVAALGGQVAQRLADNHRQGVSDDDPITCSA
jgi:nitrogen fixation protein NifU and related proteins